MEHPLIKWLSLARMRAGITQPTVAAAAGTSRSYIADLECGRNVPRLDTFERYAAGCGYRLELVPIDPAEPISPTKIAAQRLRELADELDPKP